MAKEATKSSISQLAGQKKAQEKHEAEILEEAKKLKEFLEKEDTVVELKAKAGGRQPFVWFDPFKTNC